MKKIVYLLILPLIVMALTGCENTNEDSNRNIDDNNTSNVEVRKLEATVENNENIINSQLVEEELYSFSTKLLAKEANRVSNIKIACNTINGTVVNSGDTFSFWNVIGNPTTEKGYKEAKAFTTSGGVTTAIGGGLCQVSSTVYDVVLNVPELETVERHQHTREVYYVELGYDASVSYGGADFKFKNNLSNSIKIYAECTDEAVNVRIVKLI